jgi:ankyrin repeat protein
MMNGHQEAVEFLVKRGANLTIRDSKFAATPEEWAEEAAIARSARCCGKRDKPPNLLIDLVGDKRSKL